VIGEYTKIKELGITLNTVQFLQKEIYNITFSKDLSIDKKKTLEE